MTKLKTPPPPDLDQAPVHVARSPASGASRLSITQVRSWTNRAGCSGGQLEQAQGVRADRVPAAAHEGCGVGHRPREHD